MTVDCNFKNILIYHVWKYVLLGKYSFYECITETNIRHYFKIGIINCLGSFCWLHWQVKYDIFNNHMRVTLNFSVFPTFAILCLLIQNWQSIMALLCLNCSCLPFHTSDVLYERIQFVSITSWFRIYILLRSVTERKLKYWWLDFVWRISHFLYLSLMIK